MGAEVKVFQNEWEAVVAAAKVDLATQKAEWDRRTNVAEVEASKAVTIREGELQMEVERKSALRLTEKLKAEQLSQATGHRTVRHTGTGRRIITVKFRGQEASYPIRGRGFRVNIGAHCARITSDVTTFL